MRYAAGSHRTSVVSVSLGSSTRDHSVEVAMLGRRLLIERIGVDGRYDKACEVIAQLDGKVSAIGLGGTDLYLVAGKRRYVIEESRRLAESAKVTPVVDGSGLKNTLERETIRWLSQRGELADKKVLLVSAVDRFGMAQAFVEAGCETVFGDLMFGLGLPIPIRSMRTVEFLAPLVLPILRRLPIRVIYPTGSKQETTQPRFERYYHWADVVAGDFNYIRRHLPPRMDSKTIVTNTTTAQDVALLRERGVATLVTTTPELEGRSFGTNVMEAVLVALAERRPEEMQAEDYLEMLERLGWEPRVARLAGAD
ncbi:MAG: quinate 5-dehydrogenase [Armatimonadota bacterium]